MNSPDLPLPSGIAAASGSTDDPRPSAHVIALSELADLAGNSGERAIAGNPLHLIKARLQVSVGEATMTIAQLMAVRQNEVVVLDRRVDHVVDVMLEGRVVARGQLVAVDDQFAVRITELPAPLKA